MPYVALAHAGRIHYAERGERRPGRPSAVLIHGAGASSAIWMMVLARVARGGHAIAIDLPGARPERRGGRGARRRGRADAGALPRRRRRAGRHAVPRPVGAGRAFAGRARRDRGGAGLARQGAGAGAVRGGAPAARRSRARARCCATTRTASSRGWPSTRCRPRAKPAIRRGFLAAGEATPAEVTRADFEIVRATDLGARIGGLACPVTWLDGADDRIVPPIDGRTGEIVTLPDVGHLMPIEAPSGGRGGGDGGATLIYATAIATPQTLVLTKERRGALYDDADNIGR